MAVELSPPRQKPGVGRAPPHSLEAEEYLISCCLLDSGDVVPRCISARIRPDSFYLAAHRMIFERILALHATGQNVDLAVVAEDLKTTQQLDAVGGYSFLIQVSGRIPTTAQAGYFIEKVRELALLREIVRQATGAVEDCYNFSGGIEEFTAGVRERIERATDAPTLIEPRSIMSFAVPPDNDPSILLGNRYLNRGDGAVLVSSSGMGKSSMTIQAAATWALARPFFGIQPNGPLRSLIVQAEDSEGDIAEVVASVAASLGLMEADRQKIAASVQIVTDRVHRGASFIHALRGWIRKFKPDLVWINPLLAFMDGDINDAHDAGHFLREGLNGLNEPPSFGYIVVHHTSKPPTAKDRGERKWNEVMYDMAGSADLTNWARAVLSLRATGNEGEFNLILAKRGRRAGVVKEVEQGAGQRLEVTTTIPLKHASAHIEVPGRKKPLPVIFWEFRESSEEEARPTSKPVAGRPKQHTFADFADVFPSDPKAARGFRVLHRLANNIKPVGRNAFAVIIEEALSLGHIVKNVSNPALPQYYRSASNSKKAA